MPAIHRHFQDASRRIAIIIFLGIAIGGIAALLAVGFVDAVHWLNDLLFVSRSDSRVADSAWLPVITVAVPTLGGLAVGLLTLRIAEKRPHSVPDAISEAQSATPAMSFRSGILTAIAAVLSLGSGASAGQYGPLAHLGSSVGSWISRLTGEDVHFRRIGIGCGSAAAIAAAFNAPIAGLLFAHEVILRHFSLRAFAPVTVSAVLGYVVSHIVFQRPPLFEVNAHLVANPSEYLLFIGIGVSGALVATIYVRAVLFAGDVARKLRWPGPAKTALAGLVVGLVALQIPEVRGIGEDVLRSAVTEHSLAPLDLTLILVAKLLVTALCLGFGFAGGVFSPALLIGVLFGALVGSGAEALFGGQESHVVIYAVCGMVAITGPVIGAPLTTILIVFELTQNYELATASMLSVAFANLIGYRIFGRSIFDVQLAERGLDFTHGRDRVIAQQRRIRVLVSDNFTRVNSDDTLAHTRDALVKDKRSEAYVLDGDGRYLGTVSMHRIIELLVGGVSDGESVAAYAEPEYPVLHPDDSVWTALHKMDDFVGESIPVVEDDVLIGVVFETRVINAYIETLHDVRREEHAAA